MSSGDYDYIVIGAGASGSIVAAEAAAAGYKVLLLETGGQPGPAEQDVWDPTRWYNVLNNPAYEFGFTSVPQANLNNRVMNLLQSRGTGGCQLHNAMVYVRGGQTTYDHWANDLGCTGWDYASLEPLFTNTESTMGIITAQQDAFSESFIAAAKRAGLPYNADYNTGPTEYGCVPFQFTMEEVESGIALKRTTTFQKFIAENPSPNLTVATGCFVHRLLTGGASPGVEYWNQLGTLSASYAGREVVLAAGAIMSPTILLRSGIGPADALKALDIPLVADLPAVGENFHDDLGCGFPVVVDGSFPPQPYGYLAAGAFASEAGSPPPAPSFGSVNLEVQLSTSDLPGAPNLGFRYCLVGTSAMHLASRGSVRLASANPADKPLVDPAWLSDPTDMSRCVAALSLAQELASDPQLAGQWQWTVPAIDSPEEFIRAYGLTVQHYVGSCQMGTDSSTSVVGPDLRVHGVSGFRVIDASVAPTTVTGNTAGVSMVIGAKGAALLLA
jgi:choline dehydrogenase